MPKARAYVRSSWCLFAGIGLAGGILAAAPPDWWSESDPETGIIVVDPTLSESRSSPANVGQAKWVTLRAIDSLWEILPLVAHTIEDELVNGSVAPGRLRDPVLSFDPPSGPAEEQIQFAPLQIGQLKALSEPMYYHIQSAAEGWLDNSDQQNLGQLQQNGTKVDSGIYPWTAATSDDVNNAVASNGQLKAVSSLRFNQSQDGDSMPDLWEWQIVNDNPLDSLHSPADVLPGADYDGDGVSNLDEFTGGTDPTGTGFFDSDEDGRPDVTEPSNCLNPDQKDNPAVGLRIQLFSR